MRNGDTGGRWGNDSWTVVGGSIVRLSWALALLGAQQAWDLLGRGREDANEFKRASRAGATGPVDVVVNVAEEQLGGALRGVYRMGREHLEGVGKARSS